MRSRARWYSAALLLALAFPLFVQAQFRDSTKEELQMTEDPKAPGAAAVYLNFAETADDGLHFHSVYARIKVLQDKGKELATVEIPYERRSFRVKDIKGRTIHPDGSISNLTAKSEDLLAAKTASTEVGRKVFTLPNVEVGCILEYYYELDYDDNSFSSPFWHIQKPYYVHQAHYGFTPFKGFLKGSQNFTSMFLVDAHGRPLNNLVWWPLLPPGVQMKTDAIGRYSLDVSDVPALPDEDWMPPMHSFFYHVLFYYRSTMSGAEYWTSEGKLWSKQADHFAEPSKAIHDAVDGLIAPGDSDLDKARKLYKAVQALDNTDFSRQKKESELKQLGLHAAKRAEDTWAQKSGSRQDIALLYLAMARAAGLTAYGMKVVNRDQNVFAPRYLDFDQLDDDIVILSTGGKEIFLDPGEKMCPFQVMHWKHAGSSGVRQSANGAVLADTPVPFYKDNDQTRLGDVTVSEQGEVSGQIHFILGGQEALFWRQRALTEDEDELKKEFDRSLQSTVPDGVEAKTTRFVGLDNPDAKLGVLVTTKGMLGTATAKHLLLPEFFFQTAGHRPFVNQAQRTQPVDMHYSRRNIDKIVYHLPANLTVEGAPPAPVSIPFGTKALLDTRVETAPGKVTVLHVMSQGFTFLLADEYQDLRAFYQKMAETDQQQLVLTPVPGAKGN